MNKIAFNIRLTPERMEQLDALCRLYNLSRPKVIDGLILGEFTHVQANPEAKEVIEKLKQVSEILKALPDLNQFS